MLRVIGSALLALLLASTVGAMVLGVVPGWSEPAKQPATEAAEPKATSSVSPFGARRYNLLFGADLDVIGASKIAPDISATVGVPGNRIAVGYPTAVTAHLAYIEQEDVVGVFLQQDGGSFASFGVNDSPFTTIRTWSAPGTHQLTAQVFEWDGSMTTSAPLSVEVFQSQLKGRIDGIVAGRLDRFIEGWACSSGIYQSINIKLAFGHDGQSLQEMPPVPASLPSDTFVTGQCETGGNGKPTAHRFRVPITPDMYLAYSGKPLHVLAVSPIPGVSDQAVAQSGLFKINELPLITSSTWEAPLYAAPNFVEGEPIRLRVNAADADGGIAKLEFLRNGQALPACTRTYVPAVATVTAAECNDVPSGLGSHTYAVRATDGRGAPGPETTIGTAGVIPPQPDLQTGQVVDGPNYRVRLQGTRFFQNSFVELLPATGTSVLHAENNPVRGVLGNLQTLELTVPTAHRAAFNSNGLRFRVVNNTPGLPSGAQWRSTLLLLRPNQPPTVDITSPGAGASFVQGQTISIEATATDDQGVERVEFYAGTTLLDNDTQFPYAYSWSGSTPGSHTLRAKAFDASGESSEDTVGISVTAVPVVPITPPAPPPLNSASDSIGTTAGDFRVDESGAATYRIPIFAAPGTAGVVPEMALAYSSQAGSGPLGRGWSIAGTSSISRCRATPEAGDAESALGPVSLTSGDKFCLDGQRLIDVTNEQIAAVAPCPAHSGTTARQLRTEVESFQRVCAYTPSGSTAGPRYFTVQRKDGGTSWYGDRAAAGAAAMREDGYLTADGTTTSPIFIWAQTRFQDSTGNFIDYHYRKNPLQTPGPIGQDPYWSGELHIRKIEYTGKIKLPGQLEDAHDPYAYIEFHYEDIVQKTQRSRYFLAGHDLWNTQRLERVRSVGDNEVVLREYRLSYQDGHTPVTGEQRLESVQECSSSAVGATCLTPTQFTWSGAKYETQALVQQGSLNHGSTDKFEGMKFADVDGDGLQDLLWMKDGQSAEPCPGDQLRIEVGGLDAAGRPTYTSASPNPGYVCLMHDLPDDPNSGWFLLDYDGDGKADLFFRDKVGTSTIRWRGARSLGRSNGVVSFDMVNDLLATVPILAPIDDAWRKPEKQVQLGDFNGDGLLDIVYPVPYGDSIKLMARLMERQGTGFGWGAEHELDLFSGESNPCANGPAGCTYELLGLYRRMNYQQLVDFDGDGRSDVLVVTQRHNVCSGGGSPPGDPTPVIPFVSSNQVNGGGTCSPVVHAHSVRLIEPPVATLPGRIQALAYGQNPSGLLFYDDSADTALTIHFVDVNGDSLSDAVFTGTLTAHPTTLLNTGARFEIKAPNCLDCSEIASHRSTQVVDVNGDGRADLVYPLRQAQHPEINQYFVVRYGLPGGEFGKREPLSENRVKTGCTEVESDQPGRCFSKRSFLFGDYNGDGVVEFMRIEWSGSNSPIFAGISEAPHQPRDVITTVTNGLGAVTEIDYRPLTNSAVYRQGYGSRNDNAWNVGRGAAVSDFLAPMRVVARARSSAPVFGAPTAMAEVYYRYEGARMQAGGRGFLGFEKIHSIDNNHDGQHVVTVSLYRQDFPFIGLPDATDRYVVSGAYQPGACFETFSQACLLDGYTASQGFPVSGVRISESESEWESSPVFSRNVQQPYQVRQRTSTDRSYDPETGLLLSTTVNDFSQVGAYDTYGNVQKSATRTYAGGVSAANLRQTVSTNNGYTDDPIKWHLGRLTSSVVTHSRPGETSRVRETAFGYDPLTGMLVSETLQPNGGESQHLRTFHILDGYGNRKSSHTCSSGLSEAQCKSESIVFNDVNNPLRIQRYSKEAFGAQGRYVEAAFQHFGTGVQQVQTIDQRDRYGNVTLARDVNGVVSHAALGALGRPYYSWTQTSPSGAGVSSTVTYQACGSIGCPTGAVYRQTVTPSVGAQQWTWFDALARPVMSAAQTFNTSSGTTSLGNEISAVCRHYDRLGREAGVSLPFFVAGTTAPSVSATSCSGRDWAETQYDFMGRVTQVITPDTPNSALRSIAYIGLETHHFDALDNERVEVRSVLGELASSTDAAGLTINYTYDAAGNLRRTHRTGGNSVVIQNTAGFDELGRMLWQIDPDAGRVDHTYNALGERISQTHQDGTSTQSFYDGQGRVFQRVASEGSATVTHQFGFDGAFPGSLDVESSEGSYAAWLADSSRDVDFRREFRYDSLGRATGSTTVIGTGSTAGISHHTATHYDSQGRAWKSQDASGRWLKTEYTARGFARAVCESSQADTQATCASNSADTYLQTLKVDARGNIIEERRGGVTTMDLTRTYDPRSGRLTRVQAGASGSIYDEQYEWDAAGNLTWRDKSGPQNGQYKERFFYDALHRLTSARYMRVLGQNFGETGPFGLELSYDSLGNICSKTIGTGAAQDYRYGSGSGCSGGIVAGASPHAVARVGSTTYDYDARGNQTYASSTGSGQARHIRYSAEQQSYEIAVGASQSSPTQRAQFWYGSDGQRYLREDSGSGVSGTRRTQYLGSVEIITEAGLTTMRRYVAGVAVQEIKTNTSTKYLFHDHLGSVVRVRDAASGALEGMDFGPFGERRGYADPRGLPTFSTATNRGFTGHEMLDGLDIVHMNGRIYDSRIARFLQVDPFVQEPNNPQNFNRYSYLWNNPLNGTDPSGYLGIAERQWLGVIITIAAVVTQQYWAAGFVAKTAAAYTAFVYAGVGAVSGGVSTQSTSGALWGAFSGLMMASMGNVTSGWGDLSAGLAMGTTAGTISVMQGGKFGHAFASAGLGRFAQRWMPETRSVGNTVKAALIGGSVSAISGGKFANGAVTGALSFALGGRDSNDQSSASDDSSSYAATLRTNERWSYLDHPPDGFLTLYLAHEPLQKVMWMVSHASENSSWLPSIFGGIEHGFYGHGSGVYPWAPMTIDYMPRGTMDGKSIPEHPIPWRQGMDILVVSHSHPRAYCSNQISCGVLPGVARKGPSPQDVNSARQIPKAFHMIQTRSELLFHGARSGLKQ